MRPARSSCALFASTLLVFIAPLARAQTVTNTRPCSVVEAPGASEVLDTVPESTSLRLRVEDDTDLNYAAIDWRGQAAFVPRTCMSLGFLAPGFDGFRADSLTHLAFLLTASPPAKGEYETTGEHERRIALWRSLVSVDGRSADSTFVVTVPLTAAEIAYDADRARMTVRLSQHSGLGVDQYLDNYPAPSGQWVYTYFRDTSLRNRDARGRLQRGTWPYTAYLALPLAPSSYQTRHSLLDELAFYVPRREARAAAARLRMALTVRMRPPYLSAGVSSAKPLLALHADLERAEVYDPETGRVYARAQPPSRPLRAADVNPGSVDLSSALGDGTVDPNMNGCTGLRNPPATSARDGGPPPEFVRMERYPEKISGGDPEYPDDMRRTGAEGRVIVKAWVGKDGNVRDVQVSRTDNEGFNASTIRAVCTWRFSPAIQAGTPVDVWMTIPVRFRQR